jgi:hypothetical protein
VHADTSTAAGKDSAEGTKTAIATIEG